MALPNENLASSLTLLKQAQDKGGLVISATQLSRVHLTRLVNNGYLKRVISGWYIPSRPGEKDGDTTSWYASRLEFIGRYAEDRFGKDWYLNPEISLLLHTGSTVLPKQIQLHSANAKNNALQLPAGSSLFDYASPKIVNPDDRCEIGPVRALTLESALVMVSPQFWISDPTTMEVALGQLKDSDGILKVLANGGHSVIAGRISGALKAVGRSTLAKEIMEFMTSLGYKVPISNLFQEIPRQFIRQESPYCGRIRIMWEKMRNDVLDVWDKPALPMLDKEFYLLDAEDRYAEDAYNSLSIEGYKVTIDLIKRVAQGEETSATDDNTMAAKGYFDAHNKVKASIGDIIDGTTPGTVIKDELRGWNQSLWSPKVMAGIIKPADLLGWRGHDVFITGSQHTPLNPSAVRDAMPAFFELLEQEDSPAVRAVLGHFVFVFIHPYMDGNGRLGRFLMNAMLASGGWPWTVVPVTVKKDYMTALESASVDQDIKPFAKLMCSLIPRYNRKFDLLPPSGRL